MKQIFFTFFLAITPYATFAAVPSTSCPANYTTIVEEYITIANTSCPTGYAPVGTTTSCLISTPAGSCIMYAPTNTEYTDATGTYKFTAACPLE